MIDADGSTTNSAESTASEVQNANNIRAKSWVPNAHWTLQILSTPQPLATGQQWARLLNAKVGELRISHVKAHRECASLTPGPA